MNATSATGTTAVASVCGNFGRDVEANLATIGRYITRARELDVKLLAFPEACLGGYLSVLGSGRDGTHSDEPDDLPPAMEVNGAEIRRIQELAREITVVVGLCESDGKARYNTAAVVSGDGVHGVYRKVHQPLGENLYYAPGDELRAFDTPFGRLGTLICYDKAFPEASRSLALDGAQTVVCISAWPASRTATGDNVAEDRWTERFNIFDQARALENQILWLSANQAGTFGSLRFVGNAKVVGPGGNVLATTDVAAGMAVTQVDVADSLETARRSMFHLGDMRHDMYLRGAGTRA